ncbi:MAG: hypothetical protein LBP59_18630, partial [Planctomycetaceae bacterium]|nr:hypothetical protein [Planctomycetaceae bacterium]
LATVRLATVRLATVRLATVRLATTEVYLDLFIYSTKKPNQKLQRFNPNNELNLKTNKKYYC